jgi:metal-responsive CopG/Arc/MetJ family transcriptional regulator
MRVRKTMNLPQPLVRELDRRREYVGESFSSVCIRVLTRGLTQSKRHKRAPLQNG